MLGLDHVSVSPRMTRDFEIKFKDAEQCQKGHDLLMSCTISGSHYPPFGNFDQKHDTLFASFTFPEHVTEDLILVCGLRRLLT